MIDIKYKDNVLHWGKISIQKIAEKYDTPIFIYDKKTLEDNFYNFQAPFSDLNSLVCFALKSNSNIHLLGILASAGVGADTVSGGELYLALRAGISPEKIVFSGVGKTDAEIEYALKNGVLMLNVESEGELNNVNKIAKNMSVQAPIALRINPDIDAKTHPFISTGLKENKFGIDIDKCIVVYKEACKLSNIKIKGIHIHIGSQISDISPYVYALNSLKRIYDKLIELGIGIEYINIGGGFGHDYRGLYDLVIKGKYFEEVTPDLRTLTSKFKENFGKDVRLIIEPGRRISASSAILVGKILYRKEKSNKIFLVSDTGITELIRPALYKAFHGIVPLKFANGIVRGDLVGPICESTDFLAKDRDLPDLQPGEYFAILSAGAYGFALSSNYNSRLKPPEILIDEDKAAIIREREEISQLLANQPDTLNWDTI